MLKISDGNFKKSLPWFHKNL